MIIISYRPGEKNIISRPFEIDAHKASIIKYKYLFRGYSYP